MTEVDIAALRELLAKASKGPWYTDTEKSEGEYGSGPMTHTGYDAFQICAEGDGPYFGQRRVLFDSLNSTVSEIVEESWSDEDGGGVDAWDVVAKANAALIVAAVNALPTLLDLIESLSTGYAQGFRAGRGAAARVAEGWNGETRDGDTLHIAAAISALEPDEDMGRGRG